MGIEVTKEEFAKILGNCNKRFCIVLERVEEKGIDVYACYSLNETLSYLDNIFCRFDDIEFARKYVKELSELFFKKERKKEVLKIKK